MHLLLGTVLPGAFLLFFTRAMSQRFGNCLHQPIVAAAVTVLLGAGSVNAQKTDVIILVNGDHVTGEIKKLEQGRLEYSTDDMGTLWVKWDKIVRITSRHFFQVETSSGDRYYGTIEEPTDSGTMVVQLIERYTLPLISVVNINPIRQTIWSGLDGYVDLGLDFKRARKFFNLETAAEVRYRGRKWGFRLKGTTYFQSQEDVPDNVERHSAWLQVERFMAHRWSVALGSEWSSDTDKDLDLRSEFGLSVIWTTVQTNSSLLRLSAGVNVNREKFTGSDTASVSAEAVLGGDFLAFRFDSPKLDANTSLNAYPSVTDLGRLRLEFDARFSYELLKDFTVALTFYNSFDSRPGSDVARKNTFGVTFSLGYKF
ncbi:MAG: DUF481 domain-containing protein [Gemmatimonadota bacterium]|nr:MAG: DUF481 domain-containing protein [Gemmatimonadota bacterium]